MPTRTFKYRGQVKTIVFTTEEEYKDRKQNEVLKIDGHFAELEKSRTSTTSVQDDMDAKPKKKGVA